MSRLQALLAKMGGKDVIDATAHLNPTREENVRHTYGVKYGIRWNLASVASLAYPYGAPENLPKCDLPRENIPLASDEPIFTPLPSEQCPDAYARLERLAIMAEDDLPPDRGFDDVPGFEGMAIQAVSMDTTSTPAPMQPAPATIACGSCAEFEPGPQPLCIGRCSRTLDGLPPVASRGYGACYPDAPRRCPDFRPMENPQ